MKTRTPAGFANKARVLTTPLWLTISLVATHYHLYCPLIALATQHVQTLNDIVGHKCTEAWRYKLKGYFEVRSNEAKKDPGRPSRIS